MSASFRLGPDGIYRCDAFQRFLWQEHGFGTRTASPRVDITLRQIHSDRVVNANARSGDREEEGDALITDQTGKAIGVRTADCVPILLLDAKNRAVAAVHAGWRGSAGQIIQRTLESMEAAFGTRPADVHAAFGPSIRVCCYEVREEVAARFASLFPEWGEEEKVTRQLNLPEANRRLLLAGGVPPEQIFDLGLCTTCQTAQFFSYRREPENSGRMVSSILRLA
ncbi:MAG TPA: peptidoglycan editing factor PgeF [Bryobacteraceae bacterium]|nr:peptidoglycan editing factor PgeF [Bryobacteraceae bacterium]